MTLKNYRYIFFILLLFTAQVLEYGFSVCYFCQWELVSMCKCGEAPKSCSENCGECPVSLPLSEDCGECPESVPENSCSQEEHCFSCLPAPLKIIHREESQIEAPYQVLAPSVFTHTVLQNHSQTSLFFTEKPPFLPNPTISTQILRI